MKTFFYVSIFSLLSCSNGEINESKNDMLNKDISEENTATETEINELDDTSSYCLSYHFSSKYPSFLKVSSKSIYVGDGTKIYRFGLNGDFISKINLPSQLNGYVDFTVDDQNEISIFYTSRGGKIACFSENGKIIYNTEGGDMVRIAENGNIYSIYQTFDKNKVQVINKIRIVQRNGSALDYNTVSDLGCLNLEIVNNNILLHSQDGSFHILPLDSNQKEHSYPLHGLDERVWFIGKIENYYVFRTFDFDAKKDRIHFYDMELNPIKSEFLKITFEDVVKEQRQDVDFLMDNPSATVYAYNNGKIYYLRNTKRGTCIAELKVPK